MRFFVTYLCLFSSSFSQFWPSLNNAILCSRFYCTLRIFFHYWIHWIFVRQIMGLFFYLLITITTWIVSNTKKNLTHITRLVFQTDDWMWIKYREFEKWSSRKMVFKENIAESKGISVERKGTLLPLPMCARKLMRAHSMFDCDFVHQIIVLKLYTAVVYWPERVLYRVLVGALVNFYVCCFKTETHWAHRHRALVLSQFVYLHTNCERAKRVSSKWIHDERQASRQSAT